MNADAVFHQEHHELCPIHQGNGGKCQNWLIKF